jgi:hypothetical protein
MPTVISGTTGVSQVENNSITNEDITSGIDAGKLTAGTLPIARLQNGATLQTVYAQTTNLIEIAGVIPPDNTKPQNTEGNEVLTATITPSSATSKILIQAGITGTLGNAAGTITIAFFRDNIADALASAWVSTSTGYGLIIPLTYQDSPSSTSAITYKVRLGYPGSGAGIYVNRGSGGAAVYGGTMTSWMTLTEIKA